jgi:hypothetical protein
MTDHLHHHHDRTHDDRAELSDERTWVASPRRIAGERTG